MAAALAERPAAGRGGGSPAAFKTPAWALEAGAYPRAGAHVSPSPRAEVSLSGALQRALARAAGASGPSKASEGGSESHDDRRAAWRADHLRRQRRLEGMGVPKARYSPARELADRLQAFRRGTAQRKTHTPSASQASWPGVSPESSFGGGDLPPLPGLTGKASPEPGGEGGTMGGDSRRLGTQRGVRFNIEASGSAPLVPWGGGGGLRAPGGERPGTAHAEAVRRRAEARKRFAKTMPAGKSKDNVPLRPARRLPNVTPTKSVIDERMALAAQHYRDMVSNFAEVYNSLKRERKAKWAHMEEVASEILELDLQVDFNEGLADRRSTPNLYCAMLNQKMQDLDRMEVEALIAHNGLTMILARVLEAKEEEERQIEGLREKMQRQDHRLQEAGLNFSGARQALRSVQLELLELEDEQADLAVLRKLELESLHKIRESEQALARQLNSWQNAEKLKNTLNTRQTSERKYKKTLQKETVHKVMDETTMARDLRISKFFDTIHRKTGLTDVDDMVALFTDTGRQEALRQDVADAQCRVDALTKDKESLMQDLQEQLLGTRESTSKVLEQYDAPVERAQQRLKQNSARYVSVKKLETNFRVWAKSMVERVQGEVPASGAGERGGELLKALEVLENRIVKIQKSLESNAPAQELVAEASVSRLTDDGPIDASLPAAPIAPSAAAPVLVLKQQTSFNQRVFLNPEKAEKSEPVLVPAASPRAEAVLSDGDHEEATPAPQKKSGGFFRKRTGGGGGGEPEVSSADDDLWHI